MTVTNKHAHIHPPNHTPANTYSEKDQNLGHISSRLRGTFQIYVAPIQPNYVILLLHASQQIESAPVYGRHIVVIVMPK